MASVLSRDAGPSQRDRALRWRRGQRVLALCEPGRSGAATLAEAGRLIETDAAEVTVAASAPQDTASGCCAVYTYAYNRCVREDTAAALGEARRMLGACAERARFVLLVQGRDPSLPAWVAEQDFELVLLPAHRRLWRSRHPAERGLRRICGAEIRVINARRAPRRRARRLLRRSPPGRPASGR
ncbi:MAG TPA: hypothetical protein VN772_06865 [Solirubrobacteraceae bacterium]|nr:hypothetical protein [Solirubrobacteraceae bacterium]